MGAISVSPNRTFPRLRRGQRSRLCGREHSLRVCRLTALACLCELYRKPVDLFVAGRRGNARISSLVSAGSNRCSPCADQRAEAESCVNDLDHNETTGLAVGGVVCSLPTVELFSPVYVPCLRPTDGIGSRERLRSPDEAQIRATATGSTNPE